MLLLVSYFLFLIVKRYRAFIYIAIQIKLLLLLLLLLLLYRLQQHFLERKKLTTSEQTEIVNNDAFEYASSTFARQFVTIKRTFEYTL